MDNSSVKFQGMDYELALFLFRRDLRLEDNTGLLFALEHAKKVIPAFIVNPEQVEKNPYKSDFSVRFMIDSLRDLEEQLEKKGAKLFVFYGDPEEVVQRLFKSFPIEALVLNRDYTPYSQKRDKKLESLCKREEIAFYSFDDALLVPPEASCKQDGKPYCVFTPYFRAASRRQVLPPAANRKTNYFHGSIPFAEENGPFFSKIAPDCPGLQIEGGRSAALKLLKKLPKAYEKERDFPALDATSRLSAYLKFTVCSPREVYAAICGHFSSDHPLIRSLYWRDFFTTLAFFFPHVFGGAFRPEFDRISWENDKRAFAKWCKGETGFPIVDAGMRELVETGFMHNRVRMIAASFLIKDLHIDWRLGEKFFAQNLVDYDPAVNNGNWQWVASTGADAQPYFRIFNPWSQQKKFDPECEYIKKWIPELRSLSPKAIHRWEVEQEEGIEYPSPMVEHGKEAKKALKAYRT